MKIITEDKRYSINGRLAVLVFQLSVAISEEEPLKAISLAGQITEYLNQNNDIEEII